MHFIQTFFMSKNPCMIAPVKWLLEKSSSHVFQSGRFYNSSFFELVRGNMDI